MKIKFLKDYAINRGACPLDIGGFDGLKTEIIKAGTKVDSGEDDWDGAFSDELVKWLIDNGFAEEVKESGWWEPEEDEKYFFVDNNGDVEADRWFGLRVDTGRFAIGNYFKTYAAAVRHRDYLKAVATVRQDEGVLTPEEIRERVRMPAGYCYVIVQSPNDASSIDIRGIRDAIASAIYFDIEEHAKASLDKHLNEWKIIANYDWSRE